MKIRKDAQSWSALILACSLAVSLCFNVALGWEAQAASGDRRIGIGYLAVDALPSLRLLSSEGKRVSVIPDRSRPTILLVLGPAGFSCSDISATAYSSSDALNSYRTVVVLQGMDAVSLRRQLRTCITPSHVYLLEYGMRLVSSPPGIAILGSDGIVRAVFSEPLGARPWGEIVARAVALRQKHDP